MTNIKKLLLNKKINSCVPVWFMRQAGRYLPEFRKIRAKNKNFIKLCLNSKLSSIITLQPIKRFNLDAAIIFSDILMVPYALGQNVKFIKNMGPQLSKFSIKEFNRVTEKNFTKKLSPVYKAIKKTKSKLGKSKNLICFVGAPWTLIVYMFELKNKSILNTDKFLKNEEIINKIIKKLNIFLSLHIKNQINAGADVIQIFDSWAGIIPSNKLINYCYKPNKKLVSFNKKNKIPTICFPRGLKKKYKDFCKYVKPEGINIDYDISPKWALKNLSKCCIQGGMSPQILLKDDKTMYKKATKYLDTFKNFPYIFNLGHGLLPKTKVEKLSKLINFVKNYK